MIIKVEQTKSNLKNRFEITVNNELKYLAGTPWLEIEAPLEIDKLRRCILTSIDENIYYSSTYNVTENISNFIIPMKWLFTGKQKSAVYNIIDKENNICGKFYKLTKGIIDTKYVIEYENQVLNIYDISIGKTRNILIYKDNLQIAEIIKPLNVTNNLDCYYMFLLDDYMNLEKMLSFFIVFFDYQIYSNSGQFIAYKKEVKVRYTYDKYNKFYDKNWIKNNFNIENVNFINNKILEEREKDIIDIKKQAKDIILFFIIALLTVLTIFGILYYNYQKKDDSKKKSNDTSKIVTMAIEYNSFVYTNL